MTSWLGIQFPVILKVNMIIFLAFGGHYLCLGDTQDTVSFLLKFFLYINFMLPFSFKIDDSGEILLMLQGC